MSEELKPMTPALLIKKLKKLPPDLPLVEYNQEAGGWYMWAGAEYTPKVTKLVDVMMDGEYPVEIPEEDLQYYDNAKIVGERTVIHF